MGCWFYMTANKDWFDSYTSGDFGFAYIGNNKACSIAGNGRSSFGCIMVLFKLCVM